MNRDHNNKQFLAFIETSAGEHASPVDTLTEALDIKQKSVNNKQSGALVSIYTQIPCTTPMSITTPQAKQLYQYLSKKQEFEELPNLLAILLDEIRYYYPNIEKEK